jgi:hypothetical protein
MRGASLLSFTTYSVLFWTMWFVSGLYGICTDSIVIDEAEHLTAAIQYIDSGSQTINAFHPPLLKLLAGIPVVLLLGNHVPKVLPEEKAALIEQVLFHNTTDLYTMLIAGRLAVFTFVTLALLLLWVMLRRVLTQLELVLLSSIAFLSPTMLSHARFITFDVAVALLSFLAVITFCTAIYTQQLRWWFGCMLALGCAISTKATGLVLLPIFFVSLFLLPLSFQERIRSFVVLIGSCVAALLVTLVIYHSIFAHAAESFRLNYLGFMSAKDGASLATLYQSCSLTPWLQPLCWFGSITMLMMKFIFTGLGVKVYFGGHLYKATVPYLFPVLFLLKEPLAMLGLLLLAVLSAGAYLYQRSNLRPVHELEMHRTIPTKRNQIRYALCIVSALFCISFVSILSLVFVSSGIRYLLPVYLPLALLVAMLIQKGINNFHRTYRIAVIVLVGSVFVNLFINFPHYLSHYNTIGGGSRGYVWSVDSNFDWGQDLGRLVSYVKKNQITELYLDYSGVDHPARYLGPILKPWDPRQSPPPAGSLVAVSAFKLQFVRAGYWGSNYYAWLKSAQQIETPIPSILLFRVPEAKAL